MMSYFLSSARTKDAAHSNARAQMRTRMMILLRGLSFRYSEQRQQRRDRRYRDGAHAVNAGIDQPLAIIRSAGQGDVFGHVKNRHFSDVADDHDHSHHR